MQITDLDSVQQAIANIKLEGLAVSDELQSLLYKALSEGKLTTTDLINSIMND